MAKKRKKQADPNALQSRFNPKALREKRTETPGLFLKFFNGAHYGNILIGVCLLEPINLFVGGAGLIFNKKVERGIKEDNKEVFNRKSYRWTTASGQKLWGTPFQREIYYAAQDEIYRLQAEIDKTPNLKRREEANALIEQIIEDAGTELKDVEIQSAPKGISRTQIEFLRHNPNAGPAKKPPPFGI